MTYGLYLAAVFIFFGQGLAMPLILVASGLFLWRHSRRAAGLRADMKQDEGGKKSAAGSINALIGALPRFKPLNCAGCGSGVLLRTDATLCPSCGTRGPLPEDYAKAASLNSKLKPLTASAQRNWRAANILSFPALRWIFTALIFGEPLLFGAVLVGSDEFSKAGTPIDTLLRALGKNGELIVGMLALVGFVIWMILFILLAGLSKGLRRKLPAVPVFKSAARARETANCQACGGAIEYETGKIASLCSYCHVENFRAQIARRERVEAEVKVSGIRSVLFGAMEIIEDFVSNVFIIFLILFGLPVLFAAIAYPIHLLGNLFDRIW